MLSITIWIPVGYPPSITLRNPRRVTPTFREECSPNQIRATTSPSSKRDDLVDDLLKGFGISSLFFEAHRKQQRLVGPYWEYTSSRPVIVLSIVQLANFTSYLSYLINSNIIDIPIQARRAVTRVVRLKQLRDSLHLLKQLPGVQGQQRVISLPEEHLDTISPSPTALGHSPTRGIRCRQQLLVEGNQNEELGQHNLSITYYGSAVSTLVLLNHVHLRFGGQSRPH